MVHLSELQKSIIDKGYLGENSLPLMARMGEDPGPEYFATLKIQLRELFTCLENKTAIDRELANALFGLAHTAQVHYQAAIDHGKTFRDDLMDPDLLEIEMMVESIFSGEWLELFDNASL